MLLVAGVRIALISLLAACSVISPHGGGVSASPADESASVTTTSTGTDASSSTTALTTTSSSVSSSLTTSSDGTSASSISSQATTTTSQDTTSNSVESTSTSTTSSITSTAETQSSTPSATTNGTATLNGERPSPCHNPTGPFAPFCEPNDGREVEVGETYYVRWDPSYFTLNSTIIIQLDYADPLPKEGRQAWQSPQTQNGYGFVTVKMDEAWLREEKQNNLTFSIVQMDPQPSGRAFEMRGPTVSLTRKPTTHPTPRPQPKTSRLGLLIGLPVALGVIALVVCGLFLGKRQTRKLGVGSVMGRRRGGYGVSQSRRQRMRGRHGVGLEDDGDEFANKAYVTDEGFRDEPTRGGVELDERPGRSTRAARVDSLSSLAGDEERYRDEAAAGRGSSGNAFREEVERQQRGRRL